jgi:NADH-quinone oxidoreductase subunit G
MIAALRRLGFDKVFDTNFTADLTIIEEGNELLKRVKEGHAAMIPPAAREIKFCEHFNPDLLDHLSTCKRPSRCSGGHAKTITPTGRIDPKDIDVVSIMPCTARSSRPPDRKLTPAASGTWTTSSRPGNWAG